MHESTFLFNQYRFWVPLQTCTYISSISLGLSLRISFTVFLFTTFVSMYIWTSFLMMGFAGQSPVKCLLTFCDPCVCHFASFFFLLSLVSMLYCRDCDKSQKGVLNTYFLITRGSCFTTISDNSKLSKKKFTRHRKLIHTARAKFVHFCYQEGTTIVVVC